MGRAQTRQFGRPKKKVDKIFDNLSKIRTPPRENPRSAPDYSIRNLSESVEPVKYFQQANSPEGSCFLRLVGQLFFLQIGFGLISRRGRLSNFISKSKKIGFLLPSNLMYTGAK